MVRIKIPINDARQGRQGGPEGERLGGMQGDNYVERVRRILVEEIAQATSHNNLLFRVPGRLVNFWALLVVVKGQECSQADVHDAVNVWRMAFGDHSPSPIIPFEEIPEDRQLKHCLAYQTAIVRAAERLETEKVSHDAHPTG